jgi:hypothetical protein
MQKDHASRARSRDLSTGLQRFQGVLTTQPQLEVKISLQHEYVTMNKLTFTSPVQ